jgi:hypothetical protein
MIPAPTTTMEVTAGVAIFLCLLQVCVRCTRERGVKGRKGRGESKVGFVQPRFHLACCLFEV